ncbi:beta-1-4-galactosyltransferase 4 isoform X1 [Brachionus plicatilis]|uniref:Beta-1,4-galactosyltransferase n=1 Tax=Brachionus plicatilis TaxID=10195 RepID=A0A3M7RGP3_BRAPC|nr:beta-1-4-galactosyltransferase 4 isoform X1 [Brachionus plicatilis]
MKKHSKKLKFIGLIVTILVSNFIFINLNFEAEFVNNDDLPKCQYTKNVKKSYKNEINDFNLSYAQIEENFKKRSIILDQGRSFTSTNNLCDSNGIKFKKIALIIPYRDREENLRRFLFNMHPILKRQKINYGIYLIEPTQDSQFNRGIILNAGFIEVIKESVNDKKLNPLGINDFYWDCFIFHDVDMIPEDERLMYTCDEKYPLHLAVTRRSNNYSYTGYFKNYYGGINAFTPRQFIGINGFSNQYFNWGFEDDDLRERVRFKFNQVVKIPQKIGRIFTDLHERSDRNPYRKILFKFLFSKLKKYGRALEGLETVKYQFNGKEPHFLFTKIKISYNLADYSKQMNYLKKV